MFGLNFEMVKGLVERYGASAGLLIVALGFLPQDFASASCTTESGVVISNTQLLLIAGIIGIQTIFGVKLNTTSSLAHATKVAANASTTTTPEVARVAADTAQELKTMVKT